MKSALDWRAVSRAVGTCVAAAAATLVGLTVGFAQQTGGCTYQGPGNPFTFAAGGQTSFVTGMFCAAAAGKNEMATVTMTGLPAGSTWTPSVPVDADTNPTITIATPSNAPVGGYNGTMSATSPSCPGGYYFSGNAPNFCQVRFNIVAFPINFHQVGAGVSRPGGILHFDYQWDSSSGNLADLSDCQVGENVVYPGGGPGFVWPKPPYNGETPNPTIGWLPATEGAFQDNHSPKPFLRPYVTNSFVATQEYRWQCTYQTTPTAFSAWSGISIARSVNDITGSGCWVYTVTKTGYSASLKPLPFVPFRACGHSPIVMAGITNSVEKIGISASSSKPVFGLNEPIFADLSVSNRTAETVTLDLGRDKVANIELTIQDPTGAFIARTLNAAGIGLSGEVSLPPKETFTEKLLLNEWYAFPASATYRVTATLLNDDGLPGANQPSTVFSVQVGPRNSMQLQAMAQELAAKAISGASLDEKREAARTLSHLVDPVAVNSLIQVLQQDPFVAPYAVRGLARIGTPEARAALLAAQNDPNEEVRSTARQALILGPLYSPQD
jgi:hypothetical protein